MSAADEIIISADSHMAEPPDLWTKNVPAKFKDRAPTFKDELLVTNHHLRAGGWDSKERLKDTAADGISAEVLYSTNASAVWLTGDVELEEALVRVYNDWMIEFCSE